MEKDILVAKIVATPSKSSWSQAYNAGKLFAVLSLKVSEEEGPSEPLDSEDYLNLLGKEVLETLESEFFSLETKDLASIKGAVSKTADKIPESVESSFVVGSVVSNVLYVFIRGKGRADIKRNDKFGTILENREPNLTAASGFLEDDDILILATSDFSDLVTSDVLAKSLNHQPPNEIAETLAPLIHEKESGAAAVILGIKKSEESAILEAKELPSETPQRDLDFFKEYVSKVANIIKSHDLRIKLPANTFLPVAVLILIVFLGSVFFAVKKQSETRTKAAFEQVYIEASKKYEEGQSLLDLNQNLARDSFLSAQKILINGRSKFSKGSGEDKKVNELLEKVESQLSQTSGVVNVTPKEVDSSESKLLNSELSSNAQFATKEDNDIYTLDASGVSKNGKTVVKKDWQEAGGLGVYFGNLYVLDKSAKQILKFIQTSTEFVKTNYFPKDTNPDFSKAQGMAIDGSIWVVLSDGTVEKFTKGKIDNFTLTGLDKPFKNPTRIFTNADTNNVYVLDNGNSRIVVFLKNGAYQSQYQSSVLKDAKDFEVLESAKKIFILSGSKIFRIDL